MDSPPVPKPRTTIPAQNDLSKRPVPMPRTKTENLPNSEKITATDILKSIGTVSKQIKEDMTLRVQNSAKAASERLESAVSDGTKLTKDGIERTLNTSRNVREMVTKSVMDGKRTAGLKLRSSNKKIREQNKSKTDSPRCMSMPAVDVSLFDNIQFHSPLLEQKKFNNNPDSSATNVRRSDTLQLNLNSTTFDDLSLYSDSNVDNVSNFSYDSREQDHSLNSLIENDNPCNYDTPKVSRQVSITPTSDDNVSVPEPTEEIPKDVFGFYKQDSAYENWNLPCDTLVRSDSDSHLPRVTRSTIYEFDPLKSTKTSLDGKSNELLLLEWFLNSDNYGTIPSDNNAEQQLETPYSPPTPPERFDSLPDQEQGKTVAAEVDSKDDSKSNWFVVEDKASSSSDVKMRGKSGTNNVMQRFSNMLKFDTLMKKEKKGSVERPPITQMPMVFYSGILTRVVSGGVDDLFKNSQSRYCVLSDRKFLCYADTTNSVLKEAYPLTSINSLQIVLPLSSGTSENHYCFELNVTCGGEVKKSSARKVLFSCSSVAERRNWAQKIVEHLTDGFPVKYSTDLTRFGWCFIKEGVNSEWQGAWLMLVRRILLYITTKEPTVKTVDLRKTWCVVTQEADAASKECCGGEGGENLLLDNPLVTLHMHFPSERDLKGWRYMIKLAALNNGAYIHHQQLTKEDVPAIVDKCINFIYAHGSMSEGIYRRAGASAALAALLGRFRRDAWAVRLGGGVHTEHDVAGALKRFFRDLPEPLVPQATHDRLVDAYTIKETEGRCAAYAAILEELPSVSRQAARKLFAHLHFIQTLRDCNKMTAENLAAVWAPTIMPAALTSNTLQTAWSTKEVNVVRDLISFFPAIYKPSAAELEREGAMLAVLRRVASSSAPAPQRSAGALQIWVYLKERAGGACANITLTPSKCCADVCAELCGKVGLESHELMLEEVVCGEALRRPLHRREPVLQAVLRWGYWDEEDRKDNYLLLSGNKVLHEMEAIRGTTGLVCGELKFASAAGKPFKQHTFELRDAKLTYFKDKQGSTQLGEWRVTEHLWYWGHEPRRPPHARWAITFVPADNKPKRCKERPWFGSTIAGSVGEDQLRWTAAITFAQHSASILPSPRLIIT